MSGIERDSSRHLRERGRVGKPQESVERSVRSLIAIAKRDALQRIAPTTEARHRVENALERKLYPYIIEAEVIAAQLNSREYKTFATATNQFLEAKVGAIVCPDGRILALQLGDPKVMSISRKLQGLPSLRRSTKEGKDNRIVPDDPYISAAITTDIEQRRKAGQTPRIVQFIGPHIHSAEPSHGCGDRTNEMIGLGHTPEIGMAYGGIDEYFEKLGEGGFAAFNHVAENAGGSGTVFDLIHDAYSQGFILGLRDSYAGFNRKLTLRQNLELFAKNRLIVMTEFLDPLFSQRIEEEAKVRGITESIDMSDFYNFGQNAILIGEIARSITSEQEKEGFSWMPNTFKNVLLKVDLRIAAYHSIRNVVYRVLGGIKPGHHALEKHPERLIRVGPVGADFNVKNIPFVESTVPGQFQPQDIEAVAKLYNLSYGVLKEQGVNLKEEARIILVTGIYEGALYVDRERAQEQLNLATHIVRNNAAWIRRKFERSIKTGETVVIGALHEPGTRKLIHVV